MTATIAGENTGTVTLTIGGEDGIVAVTIGGENTGTVIVTIGG